MHSNKLTSTLLFASALTLSSCGGTSSPSTQSSMSSGSTQPTSSMGTSNPESSSAEPSSSEESKTPIRLWFETANTNGAKYWSDQFNDFCEDAGKDLTFVPAESLEESDLLMAVCSESTAPKETIPQEYFGTNMDNFIQTVRDYYEFTGTINFIPLRMFNVPLFFAKEGSAELTKNASVEALFDLAREREEKFAMPSFPFLSSIICDGLFPLSKFRESEDYSFILEEGLKPAWEKIYNLYHANWDILFDRNTAGPAAMDFTSLGVIWNESSAPGLAAQGETQQAEGANPYSVYANPAMLDGEGYDQYLCSHMVGCAFPEGNGLDAETKKGLVSFLSSAELQESIARAHEWVTPVCKSLFEEPINPISQIIKDSGRELIAYESLFKDPFYDPGKFTVILELCGCETMEQFYQEATNYILGNTLP